MGKCARENAKRAAEKKNADRMLRLGVIAGLAVAIFGYVSLGMGRAGAVPELVTPDELKEAFFSGNPHLIQCISEEVPVHPATVAASKKLYYSGVAVSSLSCLDVLPSGRNFFSRFGFHDKELPGRDAPLFFLFGNGDNPLRPRGPDIKNADTIAAWAVRETTPKIHDVASEKAFRRHCLRRKECVLFLTKGDKFETNSGVDAVANANRMTRFASLDTEKVRLSFLSQLDLNLDEATKTSPKVVVIRNTMTDDEIKRIKDAKKKSKDKKAKDPIDRKYAAKVVKSADFSESGVSALLAEHVEKPVGSDWVTLVNPTARSLRTDNDDTRRRRAQREEARRQARAAKEGAAEADADKEKDVTEELELEDDEFRVSDDEGEEEQLI